MAELCLGTVQFGLNYGIQGNGQPREEDAASLLTYALHNGINIIDTAAAYGTAEIVLGNYLRNKYHGNHPAIVTKLSPSALDGVEPGNYATVMREALRASMERLHIAKVHGFLFHNASYIYQDFAVQALVYLKDSGQTEHVGVSVYTPDEAMKALEYDGMDFIQVPYNILDHRLDHCGFFEKAKEKKVTVFARSTLLQGLLCMPLDQIPAKMSFAEPYVRKFEQVCQNLSLSRFQAAVGYAAAHSGINYLVFGTDNQKQLSEFIEIAREPIDKEKQKVLVDSFLSVEERVLMPNLW